jgi:hypothetical protein
MKKINIPRAKAGRENTLKTDKNTITGSIMYLPCLNLWIATNPKRISKIGSDHIMKYEEAVSIDDEKIKRHETNKVAVCENILLNIKNIKIVVVKYNNNFTIS